MYIKHLYNSTRNIKCYLSVVTAFKNNITSKTAACNHYYFYRKRKLGMLNQLDVNVDNKQLKYSIITLCSTYAALMTDILVKILFSETQTRYARVPNWENKTYATRGGNNGIAKA